MKLASYAKSAANNLLYSPVRTLLAMIGISVGTASVVALISSGNLAAQKAMDLFKSLGTDLMAASFYAGKKGGDQRPIRFDQLERIQAAAPEIKLVAPYAIDSANSLYKGQHFSAGLVGSNESLATIIKMQVKQGRNLLNVDNNQNFCVIGNKVIDQLRDMNPLGQRIRLGPMIFTIIGVLKPWPENSFFSTDVNTSIFVPFPKMKSMLTSAPSINDVILQLKEGSNVDLVKSRITAYFFKNYPQLTVNVASSKELIKSMSDQQQTFTLLLAFIGGIALFVGGIGVMNIMLASVSERRYEIGLRLAIGAQPKDIQLMFLMEAVMLAVMGGGLGVFMGVLATLIVAFFSGWTFTLYYLPPIIGFTFSVLISVFFGFYPAYKASQLNPIEALRAG